MIRNGFFIPNYLCIVHRVMEADVSNADQQELLFHYIFLLMEYFCINSRCINIHYCERNVWEISIFNKRSLRNVSMDA